LKKTRLKFSIGTRSFWK